MSYVCKHHKCFKQIPDDIKEIYCPVHIAERKDKKEKRNDVVKKIGGGAAAFGTFILAAGKIVNDSLKKK